jgi:enolase-phosphatase E1
VTASPSRGAILLDIEGTTTPITYVYDVLFPYARRALRGYVEAHLDDEHLREALTRLREEWREDVARGEAPPAWPDVDAGGEDAGGGEDERSGRVASIVAYAEWLMNRDRKAFGLKALQGHITRTGYENGSLHGVVYPDVPVAFARWREAGIPVAIFSSGSVLAQQMLFGTTSHGDLTRWIQQFFDTTVGPKRSPESYRRIASQLGCEPARVLFISDVAAELDAAREAGCDTRLCIRGGSADPAGPADRAHAAASTFDQHTHSDQPARDQSAQHEHHASGHTAIYDFNDVM